MSAQQHNTKHDTERDPALDAAWREASREEPPAALDDAIRAAARRELGAAPRHRRDKHWWYPLAAAAMVALIAVGLLQLTPPEQVALIVAEKPTAPPAAQREPAAAPAERSDTAVAPAEPVGAAKKDAPAVQQPRSAGASTAFPQPAPRTKIETPPMDQLARAEPNAASGRVAPPAPPASAPAPRGEAFPAGPPVAAAAPQREAAASEERPIRVQTGLKRDASGEAAKPKQAGARSVEDWIKLIRDLRTEGKLTEAARELAAFREAYGERADSLLPQDLRDFKPPDAPAGAK
jgi:hypothetical protein